ncbi:unnamed protein product [Fraxinus pennsylvanica]|uniref:Uncharacterized protein n=1 Tax=Fraxinus pennsylvanica TaxID=56036 RepID=A0AAD2E594_9LAMI|nr:unnamed protein product [Fraxinus pennsylvanica]
MEKNSPISTKGADRRWKGERHRSLRVEIRNGALTKRKIDYSSGSFVLTGLIEAAAIRYTGLGIEELSMDGKAEILFADQFIATAVVLGVLYNITKSFSPIPRDIYAYDLREPFNLQKGEVFYGVSEQVVAYATCCAYQCCCICSCTSHSWRISLALCSRHCFGISYAQTRNLLTQITIHAIWNSGIILLLTFLRVQGYDIKELLQAS